MRVPEWQGWLVLGGLVVAFAVLTWWLLFSPLRRWVRPVERSPRLRQTIAVLVFISGVSFTVGAAWDELWHRQFGGFGNDFMWPPHLLMYASLGMNALFAVTGLRLALRGQGGVRERFRAEPLLGLLGLIAAYQMASIPSDLLWHQIIGPDLTAWSLPHWLLVMTTGATWLVGMAIARSTVSQFSTWRPLSTSPMDLLCLGFVTLMSLMLLQFAVTEWEWQSGPDAEVVLLNRPAWSYPVVVLLVGIATSNLALHATRRFGAATLVALVALAVRWLTVSAESGLLSSAPVIGSHLLLVPGAVVLDLWYALRSDRDLLFTRVLGSALYAAAFLVVGLPYAQQVVAVPGLVEGAIPASIGIGVLVAVIGGIVFADLGAWVHPPGRASAIEAGITPERASA